MSPHALIAALADYTSRDLPWLAARPVVLALLIAGVPILLILLGQAWQGAEKKTRALTTKEQTRVAQTIAREEAKVSQREPGRPPG
jgi:hypothetical protein